MRKWNLKKRIALLLAVMMFIMNCIPAYAEEIEGTADSDLSTISTEAPDTTEDSDLSSDSVPEEENDDNADETEIEDSALSEDTVDTYSVSGEEALTEEPLTDDPEVLSDNEEESVPVLRTVEKSISRPLQASADVPKILRAGSSSLSDDDFTPAGGDCKIAYVDHILHISGNESNSVNNVVLMGDALKNILHEEPANVVQVEFEEINGMEYKLTTGAFENFTGLTSFQVAKSIVDIEFGVFNGCTNLRIFSVASGNTHYAYKEDDTDKALYSADFKKLVVVPPAAEDTLHIDNRTEEILKAAAQGSKIRGTLNIPIGVKKIQPYAFSECSNLKRIVFNGRGETDSNKLSKCTDIGDEAFSHNGSLTKVELPDVLSSNCAFGADVFASDERLRIYYYGTKQFDGDKYTESERLRREYSTFEESGKNVVGVPLGSYIVFLDKGVGRWSDNENPHMKVILTNDSKLGDDYEEPFAVDPSQKFDIWYDIEDDSKTYDRDTKISSDLSLVARYKTEYTVYFTYSYVSSNNTVSTDTVSINVADETMLKNYQGTPAIPEPYDGYTFDGQKYNFKHWRRSNGKTYSKDALMNYIVESNETFEAVYSDVYTVKFWLDNKKTILLSSCKVADDNVIPDFESYYTDNKDKIENEYKYDGKHYVFKGWFQLGKTLPWSSSKKVYSNLDLIYGYNRYVIVSYNYGTEYDNRYPGTTVSESVLYDEAIKGHKLPMYEDLPGWYFVCWKNHKTGAVCVGSVVVQEDTIFDAVWKKVHTISFNKRTDRDSYDYVIMEGDEIEVIDGEEIGPDINKVKPEDLGTDEEALAFLEWNTKPEPEDKGDTVTRSYVVNGDMQLYARYTEGHGVRFMSDDEEAGWAVIKHGKTLTADNFPSINKLGFYDIRIEDGSDADFEKKSEWNTKPDGSGTRITTSTVVKTAMVAYAVWKDDPNEKNDPQVMVSFNTMGGPEIDPVEVSVNYAVPKPADPVWTDHKFQGWFTSTDYETEWNFDDPVTENMYLYAKWITWTEEDEDRQNGIYWVRLLRGGKLPLTEYFQESGLKYKYDRNIVKFSKNTRVVKGKKLGETMITATKVDGSEYPVSVRVFVLKQQLRDMYAYTAGTQLDANEALTVSGFPPDRWESTKPDVASIDAKTGIITVRKRGKARIKAYYRNRAVTATFRSEVPKFAKSFYRLKTGQKKKLKIKRLKKYDIVSWNVLPDGELSVDNPSWNDIEKAAAEAYSTSGNSTSGNRSASMNQTSSNVIMGIGSAEIDANGRITPYTAGDVIVYAAVYGQIITTKVHIEPPILRTKSLILKVNTTTKLKLSRTKLKNVEWKSSNDQVAYVDPLTGKVYALKNGRVTLRTTAGGVVNSCAVQVQDTSQLTKGPALSR